MDSKPHKKTMHNNCARPWKFKNHFTQKIPPKHQPQCPLPECCSVLCATTVRLACGRTIPPLGDELYEHCVFRSLENRSKK